jgi:putative transposase
LGSLGDAWSFTADFVNGCDRHHCLTGIGLKAPADVHYGRIATEAVERAVVMVGATVGHSQLDAT